MSYQYVNADTSNQYAGVSTAGTITEARYIPSVLKSERGKRLIEALPLPRIESREWQTAYTIPMQNYKWNPDKPKLQKLKEAWELRKVRFPLPFAGEIEREFYRAVTDSYCTRYLSEEECEQTITVKDRVIHQSGIITPDKSGAVVGFSLLGSSQSGKTSALKILTDWYPQVIEHHMNDGGRFIQIVYLNVECQTHSNMRSMFDAIGHEIDRALGNTEEVYELMFRGKNKTIAQKEQVLRRLIDTFAIGALILEECQAMNFNSQDEKSFEAFLTLCNETGVALIMVGTEDARKKMFGHTARTAHRVGPEIKSDLYCKNSQFLTILIKHLFNYQWFDEEVKLTPEIAEALIRCSHGIIGLLVRIYIYMNTDYITAYKKPVVDEKYVVETARRHFSEIISLLENSPAGTEIDAQCRKAFKELDRHLEETIASEERQNDNIRKLNSSSAELEQSGELKAFLLERCLDDYDYDERQLKIIIDQEISSGSLNGISRREAYRRLRVKLKELQRISESATEHEWEEEANSSAPFKPFKT